MKTKFANMIGFWFVVTNLVMVLAQSYIEERRCIDIQGDLGKGCYECDLCSEELRNKISTKKLQITDKYCQTTELCCKPQIENQARSGGSCGERKEITDQKRSHIRSVLPMEYPWRAWVFIKNPQKRNNILCAGTAIDDQLKVILSSANCVYKYQNVKQSGLMVTFSRELEEPVSVDSIILHEDYNPDEPFINDIALIVLNKEKEPPSWVMPACTSYSPPMFETSCTFMSEEDYFIDNMVPMKSDCSSFGCELDESQLCTISVLNDYEPEIGGGLFCQDPLRTATNDYFISGIVLDVRGQMTVLTNVSHFKEWLRYKTENIQ